MHFAMGMCGGAALTIAPCLILRRGWRFIPVGMTLGGLWALIPDMPRIWREDFTSLPFAATLGSKDFENWLHSIGDLFFFHQSLDAQPKEFALLGLAMIIGLYNLCMLGFLWHARMSCRHGRLPRSHPYSPNAYDRQMQQKQAGKPPSLPDTDELETDGSVIARIHPEKSAS